MIAMQDNNGTEDITLEEKIIDLIDNAITIDEKEKQELMHLVERDGITAQLRPRLGHLFIAEEAAIDEPIREYEESIAFASKTRESMTNDPHRQEEAHAILDEVETHVSEEADRFERTSDQIAEEATAFEEQDEIEEIKAELRNKNDNTDQNSDINLAQAA